MNFLHIRAQGLYMILNMENIYNTIKTCTKYDIEFEICD
jgi:hypothetical protein